MTLNMIQEYPQKGIPIGVAEYSGAQLWWRPQEAAHALVVGPGAGRIALMENLVANVAASGWTVADGEAVGSLTQVYSLMKQRYESLREHGINAVGGFAPALLFFNDYRQFHSGLLAAGRCCKAEALAQVSDLVSMGRSVRIHVVFSLTQPDLQLMSSSIRDNCQMRISTGGVGLFATQW